MNCNEGIIGSFIYIFKNLLNIIWIVGPILAIISLTINITLLATKPDEKKTIAKIKNSVIALVILFFIPLLVNAVINLVDNDFSECWNSVEKKANLNPTYMDPTGNNQKKNIINNPDSYERGTKNDTQNNDNTNTDSNKSNDTSDNTSYDTSITSCGELEYCNKYLTSLFNNSQKLNDAIIKYNASVVYSNDNDPESWEEAINVAKAGKTVKISCNRPTHWSMRDITGRYRDFYSKGKGGFENYKGELTKYTKQLIFDGSKSVKKGIQDGTIQPGDIIGTTWHTFTIYTVDRKTGSAVVFDGGHRFTNRCQSSRKCRPMLTYSASTNSGLKLYQLIRWIK